VNAEGIAVGADIEVCRRVLSRNPDTPVKIVNERCGFYEAAPAVRACAQPPAVWVQFEPGSLAVTVRVLVAADPPAEAGHWTEPYPTLQARRGAGRHRVIETRTDPPAILSRVFREQLQARLDEAMRLVEQLDAARCGHAAVSHV
jgi:hypothetical protein